MEYNPFSLQAEFIASDKRIRCLFAAKRSGKSEIAILDVLTKLELKPNFKYNGRDPYLVVIIAPTDQMLKKLTWPKLFSFAPWAKENFNKSENKLEWDDKAICYGISAEKIERMEGLKVSHIFMDEAFQMNEHVLYESLARLSDTQGTLTIAGSLGTNIPNPKNHWLYQTFKEKQFDDSQVWEWTTGDNPYFPKEELYRMQTALDPRTYRQLFEIDWNVPGTNLVYDEFDQANLIQDYKYNPELETIAAVDWGWSHPMACLFFQYDRKNDTAYLFDEIVESKLKREQLYDKIKSKGYRITHWYCDIAGKQERESAISNIDWFKAAPRNIHFKFRSSNILYGIPIVRRYIRNGLGQVRLYVDEKKCPKSIDCIRNYSYPEKNGIIQNENPEKKDDDACDAIRYFFVNHLDDRIKTNQFKEFNRWGTWQF